jgi:hypothetical protein
VLGFFDDVLSRLPVRSLGATLREAVVRKFEHRTATERKAAHHG